MPDPAPFQVKIFPFPSSQQPTSLPEATATLPSGWKLLCGGAQVVLAAGATGNNMLTASFPNAFNAWTASSIDQTGAATATITIYMIAIYDPNDAYDVQIFTSTSGIVPNLPLPGIPSTATSAVAAGYTLVGGGAQANYGLNGRFLISSAPTTDLSSWTASCADHLMVDRGSVTAYAIGVRSIRNAPAITIGLHTDTSKTPASGPSDDIHVGRAETLIGGGAMVMPGTSSGVGNFLVESYPEDDFTWSVAAHDDGTADLRTIMVYAIGATFG